MVGLFQIKYKTYNFETRYFLIFILVASIMQECICQLMDGLISHHTKRVSVKFKYLQILNENVSLFISLIKNNFIQILLIFFQIFRKNSEMLIRFYLRVTTLSFLNSAIQNPDKISAASYQIHRCNDVALNSWKFEFFFEDLLPRFFFAVILGVYFIRTNNLSSKVNLMLSYGEHHQKLSFYFIDLYL